MYLFYCLECGSNFQVSEEAAPEATAPCPQCGAVCSEPGLAGEGSQAEIAAEASGDLDAPTELVPVGEFETANEARLICTLLANAGIRSLIDREDSVLGFNTLSVSGHTPLPRVLVARRDEQLAVELLERLNTGRTPSPAGEEESAAEAVSFLCEECGGLVTFPGDLRGHVARCPECDANLDVPE